MMRRSETVVVSSSYQIADDGVVANPDADLISESREERKRRKREGR